MIKKVGVLTAACSSRYWTSFLQHWVIYKLSDPLLAISTDLLNSFKTLQTPTCLHYIGLADGAL
jgi:hypothetical protein